MAEARSTTCTQSGSCRGGARPTTRKHQRHGELRHAQRVASPQPDPTDRRQHSPSGGYRPSRAACSAVTERPSQIARARPSRWRTACARRTSGSPRRPPYVAAASGTGPAPPARARGSRRRPRPSSSPKPSNRGPEAASTARSPAPPAGRPPVFTTCQMRNSFAAADSRPALLLSGRRHRTPTADQDSGGCRTAVSARPDFVRYPSRSHHSGSHPSVSAFLIRCTHHVDQCARTSSVVAGR